MTNFHASRRTVARGAAWAVPVVAVAAQAPAFATSGCAPFAEPAPFSEGVVQAKSEIRGGYACWGPGEGSGSDGCTGATEPRRYWVNNDGLYHAPTTCENFNVWHATRTFQSTVANGDIGPRRYTFTGSLMTNYGNHRYITAYGAGVALQVRLNGTGNWTTKAVYVTRDASDTNPMPSSSYTGCTWAAGFTNIIKLAPGPLGGCNAPKRFANGTYNFTVDAPTGTTSIEFRRLIFVAPRNVDFFTSCNGPSENVSASDDISISDATVTCSMLSPV